VFVAISAGSAESERLNEDMTLSRFFAGQEALLREGL
jgi:hypothetical protein